MLRLLNWPKNKQKGFETFLKSVLYARFFLRVYNVERLLQCFLPLQLLVLNGASQQKFHRE